METEQKLKKQKSQRKKRNKNLFRRKPILVDRDENGSIVPQKVKLLDQEEKEIVIRPLSIGEIKNLRGRHLLGEKEGIEDYVRETCLLKPKFNKEEFKRLKIQFRKDIIDTILFESGLELCDEEKKNLSQKQKQKSRKRKIYEKEKTAEAKIVNQLILHKYNYTMFSYPKLTIKEIKLIKKIHKKTMPDNNG